MGISEKFLLINNIKLSVNASESEAFSVARRVVRSLGLSACVKDYSIFRRSVDARRKPDIYYVYSVAARGDIPPLDERSLAKHGAALHITPRMDSPVMGKEKLSAPPVIVGSGPCGLFAALILAEWGYRPVILERGGAITDRARAVEEFQRTHALSPDCNIQFGAGGAGTFSDGKLVTRINDPLSEYVIERFVEFGAQPEIKYIAKPHVGTDVLSVVVDRMIDRIISLGGSIQYNTKYLYHKATDGRVTSVITDKGEMAAGALILAIGHSARDTYKTLIDRNMCIEAKNFSVGMRIEHLAEDIDRAMYGSAAGTPGLGHAEYTLSHNTKVRGTYTFCMCPGGVVVPAASEEGGVVVNGMSYSSRNEKNSNSAVVTTVFREDYGNDPTLAIEFQRSIEQRAFISGGGDYSAPVITVGDLLSGEVKTQPKRVLPSYMGGENYRLADPREYLPDFVIGGISSALADFDKKIQGFAAPDAILTGAETRTSAPLRILRYPDTGVATGYSNLYPAGEGAGYAGGITSAAIDGIKSALKLMERFASIEG